MAKAFDLIETSPFPTNTFGELDTDRPGFTFNPDWESDFSIDPEMPNLQLSDSLLNRAGVSRTGNIYSPVPASTPTGALNQTNQMWGDYLSGLKSNADTNMKVGTALKTAKSAMKLFGSIMNYGFAKGNARLMNQNAKQRAENEMLALDNRLMYYKNQIIDKFGETMAQNSVTMAMKNLRVTAANIMEQTKDAAYDATQDIKMAESNADLKKIAIRAEEQQTKIASKLMKKTAFLDVMNSLGELGITVGTGMATGGFGNLFSTGLEESLNTEVYGS